MAEIDIGFSHAHRLQPCKGVTAAAALAEDRILPDDAAKIRPTAVLGDGIAFIINGDDRRAGKPGELILYFLPKRNVQNGLQVKISP